MPLSGDEPVCPTFQPNIFDPSRCHDCLRQKHLHVGAGETTATTAAVAHTGTSTGTGTGELCRKQLPLTPVPSQAEEKYTSGKEDSDSLSVVSSYCDVSAHHPGYQESSLWILSPDCELYLGDGDDSSDSRDQSDYPELSGSISAEDDYLPLHRHQHQIDMTRLDHPPHRPNPRAWMEEAHSRDGFSRHSERENRDSGYFSLGRAAGARSLTDKNPPAPYRHFERGHPLFNTRTIEPKDTIPFRNPILGVASDRQSQEALLQDLPEELPPPPDPYEIAVEVEAQVGPRSPSPTPFKIAESLASTSQRGFNSARGTLSSSSRQGSAIQSRATSPSRGPLPFRRSESTPSLNRHTVDGGGRSQGRAERPRSPSQSMYGRGVDSGTLPRNLKSIAGSVKSVNQTSTVSDFRTALRKNEVNGSLNGRGQDNRSSSTSKRDYNPGGQSPFRKTEITSSLSNGWGRRDGASSRTSSPSGRTYEGTRDSQRSSSPRRNYTSSTHSLRHKSESLTSLNGHGHHGRCGSPIREGYDIESQSMMRNLESSNGLNKQELDNPSQPASRRGYDSPNQPVLRKNESNSYRGSRGCEKNLSSSPERRSYEAPGQYSLRRTDTAGSLSGHGYKSRNSSPSRRSSGSPNQSPLRKSETSSSVRSRDSRSLSPSRKSCDAPSQSLLRKTDSRTSLNSRSSSPSRKGHEAPGYSVLRKATSGDASRSYQRKNTHSDARTDSNPAPRSWRDSVSVRSSSLSRASSPTRQASETRRPGLSQRSSALTIETTRASSINRSGGRGRDLEECSPSPKDKRPSYQLQSPLPSPKDKRPSYQLQSPSPFPKGNRPSYQLQSPSPSPKDKRPSYQLQSSSPSPQVQMRRHTSSQSSIESSESGQLSAGSTGRNKEEYAMLADVPKIKIIPEREGLDYVGSPQNRRPPGRQELFKPASHSLSKHPSRDWEDPGDPDRESAGYLSRAQSYTSLHMQRSGSPSVEVNGSLKDPHRRPEEMQPDLLNFKKGWMSKLDDVGEWKKHWFVLTDAGLKYYRDSTAEEKDDLDGEIDLKSCVKVLEFDVEKNYGFQIQTREAVFTLSAMTAGIRRNWIEVLKKCIRPSSSPDLTQLPDGSSDKENSHARSVLSSRRTPSRHTDARPESLPAAPPAHRRFDYVELSPVPAPSSPLPASQREAGEGQGREHIQWEERNRDTSSQWEAVLSRKGHGSDPRLRLEDEIEKKWAEFERLPLKEMRSLPAMGSRPTGQSANEALQREVASLRQQLERFRVGGAGVGGGCGPEAPCGHSLAAMERAHRQALEELQKQHERQTRELAEERDRLLLEGTRDTERVMEALKKAHKEEMEREVEKAKRLSGVMDSHTLRTQQQAETQALQRELAGLSEHYSQKCLELNRAEQSNAERERDISRKERDMEQLRKENQDLQARLTDEISRMRAVITGQGSEVVGSDNGNRMSCELEVLLRVKENEVEYLYKEISCLRNELQFLNTERRLACERYKEVREELSGMKDRSEREIQSLKEHLRLAMAALQEGQVLGNSLDH